MARIITAKVILRAAGGLGVHTEIQNNFLKRIISSRFHCIPMLERRDFVNLGPNKQVANPFEINRKENIIEIKSTGNVLKVLSKSLSPLS